MNKSTFTFIMPALGCLFAATSAVRAETAAKLGDFEQVQEPVVRCIAETGKCEPDDFVNITEVGEGTLRMTLRYHPDWWDGDQASKQIVRQRAEVRGLGPGQKSGETFEYATTFRTDPAFHGTDKHCHFFQLKATDGDYYAPLVVMTVRPGAKNVAVLHCSGEAKDFSVAREFDWKPGEWLTVRIRIKTSADADGEVTVSVNGDAFQGATGLPVLRPRATNYTPKWGLFRAITPQIPVGTSWVEHRDVSARKL